MSPPVLTYTDLSAAAISSLPLTGTGVGGAVVAGASSSVASCRIYNNQTGAAGIADALNCVVAVYDDTTHQGAALTTPTASQYLQVLVLNYDGSTTGADTRFWPVGGTVKHAVPTNGGTLSGAGTGHYLTLQVQAVLPTTATSASVSQGLWLEYSFVS